MTWTYIPGEDGFMISKTTGSMSEPWGIILTKDKTFKILEWLEWGETVEKMGLLVSPKPPSPLKSRKKTPTPK